MGFGAEMKDFISAFSATSSAVGNVRDRAAKRDRTRIPGDSDLIGLDDPFSSGSGAIPEASVSTDTSGDGTITGGEGTDTLDAGGPRADRIGSKPSQFVQDAYNYYRSKGLSAPHAAGFAANFGQESGGAADVISGQRRGDAGKSGFIGQWQGKRLTNLYAFAGTKTPSVQQQLDFALEEGNPESPYRDDGAVKANQLAARAQTPDEATALIRKYYERPSADDLHKRLAYARGIDLGASGGGQFASSAMPQAQPIGVIPDLQGQDQQAAAPQDGGQDPSQDMASSSPAPGIQINPIDVTSQMQVPQVVYARRGGVIPER